MTFRIINDGNYKNYITSIKVTDQDFDLTDTGYLFVYNNKTSSNLILTLPTNSNYIGINFTIKNPSLTYQVLSSVANIKQFDGTVSNLICGTDNFSSIVYDGTYWLVCMSN